MWRRPDYDLRFAFEAADFFAVVFFALAADFFERPDFAEASSLPKMRSQPATNFLLAPVWTVYPVMSRSLCLNSGAVPRKLPPTRWIDELWPNVT